MSFSVNKILLSKKVNYTRHAKNRMHWRKISKAEVSLVLKNPDKINKNNDKYTFLKKINKKQIKVVFVENKEEILIITAFDKTN